MTQPTEEPIQAFNAAFGRSDLGAMQQFFARDLVWHVTGTGPLAGDYQGVAQVMGLVGKLAELTGGSIQHELHDVLHNSDHTVVLATYRAERAGKQIQENVVHVIHGDGNGHATEIWTHGSDPAAAAEFWS
jgi:ketosteroid isomerase-like protein